MRRPSHTLSDDDLNILQQSIDTQQEQENTNPSWQEYQCELVTPLYGGGVKAGEVDTQMPIRASEIRGHLRFWWRLLYGDSNDSKGMFKRECNIWGGIGDDGATKSKVAIKVSKLTKGSKVKLKPPFGYDEILDRDTNKLKLVGPKLRYGHEYALFPFRDSTKETKNDAEQENKIAEACSITFHLDISFSKEHLLSEQQVEEVNEALRWWASFGGIGARTRRGLGAVKVQGLEPVTRNEVTNKKGRLEFSSPKPDSSKELYIDDKFAEKVWDHGIIRLKAFRQGAGFGRTRSSEKNIPGGESLWPEPDSIRNISGYAYKHQDPDKDRSSDNKTQNSFPRAAFGLPIVFHFKDSNSNQPNDKNFDPPDHTLEPSKENQERMASPVIVRPYWDGDQWKSCALLIPRWDKALSLPVEFRSEKDLLRNNQPKVYPESPNHWGNTLDSEKDIISKRMKHISSTKDPLTAFMDFFEKGK